MQCCVPECDSLVRFVLSEPSTTVKLMVCDPHMRAGLAGIEGVGVQELGARPEIPLEPDSLS